MKKMILALLLMAGLARADGRSAAHDLIERWLPGRAGAFTLETIPAADGSDVYEVESAPGGIVLRGNSGVALASAFYCYVTEIAGGAIGWEGARIELAEPPPPVPAKIRRVSPYRYRAYLNYCVYSYTMSFWDRARWQREIDWMALHGINLPLQVVGQEATWLATFQKLGLTYDDMKDFFVGPAYFAWGWMNNIDGIGGPLSESWIKERTALGQWLLAQQRALGMTPVLQGFSGRVPGSYARQHPESRIAQIHPWGDIPGTFQMDPTDPLFDRVGRTFIEEQTRLFGTDHFYAADPFHEGQPPSTAPDYLSAVGSNIYATMSASDPAATWVMQSWSLREPILKAAPADRLIVFDLNGGRSFGATPFWGRATVWGILNNFGGRHYLSGPVGGTLKRAALGATKEKNLAGFGLFDEAIELNPVMAEALYESAWKTSLPEAANWAHTYAARRYGADTPELRQAWDVLLKTVYDAGRGYDSLLRARPALHIEASSPCAGGLSYSYDNARLAEAWASLLAAAPRCAHAPGYRFDLVNVGEQALNNYALAVHHRLVRAFQAGDRAAFDAAASELETLITDLDDLLGTHEMFLLGKWIADARAWGRTDAEKDQFESNARALVSVWEVTKGKYFDYSARSWNGLYRQYYLPRWQKFHAYLRGKLDAGENGYRDSRIPREWGRPIGAKSSPFYADLDAWEKGFAARRDACAATPTGDLVQTSARLLAKYQPRIQAAAAVGYNVSHSYREPQETAVPVKKANLTSGKKVTTNGGQEGGRHAEYAVDGAINRENFWAAQPGPAEGRWLAVDLGAATNVTSVRLWPYWGEERRYEYVIETSTDGLVWQAVASSKDTTGPETEQGRLHKFAPVSARFVRARMLKNSANPSLHLVEFWVNAQ